MIDRYRNIITQIFTINSLRKGPVISAIGKKLIIIEKNLIIVLSISFLNNFNIKSDYLSSCKSVLDFLGILKYQKIDQE